MILLIASLGFTTLLLVLLELALGALGLGAPDASHASQLKYQQIYLPLLEPARLPDGTAILQTVDERLPYQVIRETKPANGLRVVTLGGSATAGLGFSPNVTFARHLERMLHRAYTERTVEVLNLGIVALAARQVQVLAEYTCRELDPDVVIVYSGNNEFLELHAQKYAAAHDTAFSKAVEPLKDTNLYRAVSRAVWGDPSTPALADQDFSKDDLRLTQEAIIRDIEVDPEEIREVVARYGETIGSVVRACEGSDAAVVLATVASNWAWRGRKDLPEDWQEELGIEEAGAAARDRRSFEVLSERLAESPAEERWELLFRRAFVAERLGDLESARADYRASMNEDPHLRRALDRMADEVRAVAAERGVPLMDTIDQLGHRAEGGIVGFDEFYDYVHFTPRGTVLMAEGLFETLVRHGIVPAAEGFDAGVYVRERLEALAGLERDYLDVGEFLGFAFDPAMLRDRDLWKYDRMKEALDARIAADPADVEALVYRGNMNAFRIAGADEAERDYRAALAAGGTDPAIQANLDRLLAGRPD